MALHYINWSDSGSYKSGWYRGKASRKDCGQYAYFQFTSVGAGRWTVRRYGGLSHSVRVCESGGLVLAECDCYDFLHYGAGFDRACIHIWAVRLRKSLVGC